MKLAVCEFGNLPLWVNILESSAATTPITTNATTMTTTTLGADALSGRLRWPIRTF